MQQTHYNALSMARKMPKITPFHLGFRHPAGEEPSHGQRQNAQKIGKGRARGSGDSSSS